MPLLSGAWVPSLKLFLLALLEIAGENGAEFVEYCLNKNNDGEIVRPRQFNKHAKILISYEMSALLPEFPPDHLPFFCFLHIQEIPTRHFDIF